MANLYTNTKKKSLNMPKNRAQTPSKGEVRSWEIELRTVTLRRHRMQTVSKHTSAFNNGTGDIQSYFHGQSQAKKTAHFLTVSDAFQDQQPYSFNPCHSFLLSACKLQNVSSCFALPCITWEPMSRDAKNGQSTMLRASQNKGFKG